MNIEAKLYVNNPYTEDANSPIVASNIFGEDIELALYFRKQNRLEIRADQAKHFGKIVGAFADRYGPFTLNQVWSNITWV